MPDATSKPLKDYNVLIFDCDGVILNSNKIKTKAFYDAVKSYGEEVAQRFVEFHIRNGGISRYAKIRFFITDILNQSFDEDIHQTILNRFSAGIKNSLMSCEVVRGLSALRAQTPGVEWLIASGGDQAELRAVFQARKLSQYFDGGIWGSPRSKIDILTNTAIEKPALFIGDSKYDHWVSTQLGLEFLFVTDWTEVTEVDQWLDNEKSINHCRSIADLLLPT